MKKNDTIPKIIHYCWFGGKELPEEAKKCIESWKKYCPDYEIIEWNENNFDLNSNDYVREAYDAKKWAFITDYVRLYVLVKYGGIYMDTDVEVLKSLDPFLNDDAFSGFESNKSIPTGIMASKKNQPLMKELLDYYKNKHFKRKDGTYDLTTNVIIITNICKKYGLKLNNEKQVINGFSLYPKDYFCPKSLITGIIELTDNSHTIHHFSGSWVPEKEQKYNDLRKKLSVKYNKPFAVVVVGIYSFPYRLKKKIKEYGVFGSFKFLINKAKNR